MASSGRPACPCCIRRAEQMLALARRRLASALTAAGLAALAVLCWSAAGPGNAPAGRIVLIVAAVTVAAAFAVVPRASRAYRERGLARADWRTWPPGFDPWSDGRGNPGRTEQTGEKGGAWHIPSAKVKP